MKYTVKLLDIDKPDKWGRVFTKECAESIVDSVKNTPNGVFVEPPKSLNELTTDFVSFLPNPAESCGLVQDAEIKDDYVVAEFDIFDATPNGRRLKAMIEASDESCFSIAPRGFGTVGKDGAISDYRFIGFDLLLK